MNFFDKPIVKKTIFFLRLTVPIVLVGVLFAQIDYQTFFGHLRTYPIGSLLLAVLLIFFANIIFGFRWWYILKSVNINLTLYQVFRLTFFSLFLSNFLPSSVGGDFVKLVGIIDLVDKEKNDIKISSVIVDRLFSMLSKVLLLPFALSFLGTLKIQVEGIATQLFFPFTLIPQGIRDKISSYLNAIKPWYSWRIFINILLISWLSLTFTTAGYWVIAQPLNPSVSPINILYIAIITYFAIILPISINGIGVQEMSYVYLLGLLQFTQEQAWTVALIIRLTTIIISLMGGLWMVFDGRELFSSLMRNKLSIKRE